MGKRKKGKGKGSVRRGSRVENHSPIVTKSSAPEMTIKQSKSNDNRDGDEDRESAAAGQIITPNGKMFTYEELKSVTGNFSPDTVVVREGGSERGFKILADALSFLHATESALGRRR